MLGISEITRLSDITDLDVDILETRQIRLLGIDIENVLTDYGDTQVRSDASEHLGILASQLVDLDFALITNKTDKGFVREVSEQLGNTPYYQPCAILRNKTKPDMFDAAISDFSIDSNQAALVDDQLKSILGLRMARWGHLFWPKPYGERQHQGVKAFRPIENLIFTSMRYFSHPKPALAAIESRIPTLQPESPILVRRWN